MQEELLAVRKSPLFSGLLFEELVSLLGHARIRELRSHQNIFTEGDKADALYFVLSGAVRLFTLSPRGDEKVIELIMPGSTFAEAVVFLGGHYPVYAATLTDSRLIEIPTADFICALTANSGMALRMLAGVSMRLHQLINDVRSLTLETAGQRVAGFLLEQCPLTAASADIHMVVKKNVVASRIGVSAETFSRVLATLRTLNLITVSGNDIHVADRAGLERWRDKTGD
ncbi:MAG: Crp/Fnr family transcriptional regulator [Acidiferrobacter sp.]